VYESRTLFVTQVVFDVPAGQGSLPVRKHMNLLGFHDSGGPKIDVHIASRDQSVDIVAASAALSFTEKIAQPEARPRRNFGLNDFADGRRDAGTVGAPVVFQVLDVALQRPIDLCRRSESIIKPEPRSVRVSRRTSPASISVSAVTIRALLGQPLQLTLVFALLPPGRTLVKDEIVWRMQDRQAPPVGGFIIERDRWRLVVVLQDVRVVLHLINERQFNSVAFKLDGHAHFSAGIAAAHILAATPHPPRGTGRPNLRNDRLRFRR